MSLLSLFVDVKDRSSSSASSSRLPKEEPKIPTKPGEVGTKLTDSVVEVVVLVEVTTSETVLVLVVCWTTVLVDVMVPPS